jgi:hypothetical protein
MQKALFFASFCLVLLVSLPACNTSLVGLYVEKERDSIDSLMLFADGTYYECYRAPMFYHESDGSWRSSGGRVYLNSRLQLDSTSMLEEQDTTLAEGKYRITLRYSNKHSLPPGSGVRLVQGGDTLFVPLTYGTAVLSSDQPIDKLLVYQGDLVQNRREPLPVVYTPQRKGANSFVWTFFVYDEVFSYETMKNLEVKLLPGRRLKFPKGKYHSTRVYKKAQGSMKRPVGIYLDFCCPTWEQFYEQVILKK